MKLSPLCAAGLSTARRKTQHQREEDDEDREREEEEAGTCFSEEEGRR